MTDELISEKLFHLNMSSNDSSGNKTYDEISEIEKYLGPRYMDLWTLAVLNSIYILIFLTGIVGNMCTCVVIARNRYMHTATNCYLFSLAISDVLILILENDSVINVTISEETRIEEFLGVRYMDKWELALLNLIYISVFVSGVLGNTFTCIVIVKNRYMHTATNYYLFSLAVSDILILVLALPPELYTFWEAYPWRFGEGYCYLKTYIQEMTSYASVLTIAAFTIERYLAICHPMTSQILNSPSRAVKLIVVQWVIACLCAVPFPYYTRTFYVVHDPVTNDPYENSLMCNIPNEYRDTMTYWFQVSTFVFFVYPMSVIIVMYILIGFRLQRTEFTADRNNAATAKARKVIIKMLVAVCVAFFVCWAPFHAQRLMTIYITDWTPELMEVQNIIFHISGVLYFVSSTVNPILYNAMSRKYRRAFVRTIFPCRSRSGPTSSASISPGSKSSPYAYNKMPLRQQTKVSVMRDSDGVHSSLL